MSENRNSSEGNFYRGSFAEFVLQPSLLSYSFFKDWFAGSGSLGKAMKLLKLPFENITESVLEMHNNELVVNLLIEEKTLYRKTIFSYATQTSYDDQPKLIINFFKLFNPICVLNTINILLQQSQWIAKPNDSLILAKSLVDSIPAKHDALTIEELDLLLKKKVWPNVIAVGLLSEFYSQLLARESKENYQEISSYISNSVTRRDWFFKSISNQSLVNTNQMSFDNYFEKYGMRSDKDYELTSPRWEEIRDVIKKRIENSAVSTLSQKQMPTVDKKTNRLITTTLELQLLRSEAKRKTLIHFNQLRQLILEKTNGAEDVGGITKEELLHGDLEDIKKISRKKEDVSEVTSSENHGKGISVCIGRAKGVVKNISNNDMEVGKGTIGIFPNASPEFATQYPKCSGMIFLRGGQTSHGSIVAREFGIPAIIDNKAQGIKDGVILEMDGDAGEWKIL